VLVCPPRWAQIMPTATCLQFCLLSLDVSALQSTAEATLTYDSSPISVWLIPVAVDKSGVSAVSQLAAGLSSVNGFGGVEEE
jgi:hypothetical protein